MLNIATVKIIKVWSLYFIWQIICHMTILNLEMRTRLKRNGQISKTKYLDHFVKARGIGRLSR